jgi:phenylacetate-CoA ligase
MLAWRSAGRRITNYRIRKTINRAFHSKVYREIFESVGIIPKDIRNAHDLETKVPITRREQISMKTRNPYDLLAIDYKKECVLFGQTSGTQSGHSVPVFMTKKEFKKGIRLAMKMPVFRHVGKGDRVALLFPMVRTFAGTTAAEMVQQAGALLAVIGTRTTMAPPEFAAETLLALRPTIIGVCPTDGFALSQIFQDWGYDPLDLGIEKIVIGAEPCSPNRMKRLKEIFGAKYVFNVVGQNEIGLPGIPCENGNTHFPSSVLYVELWAPDLSRRVDYNEKAVPVITTLYKKAAPVLRYWTDDIVIMREGTECPCGLKFPLYNILGRAHTEVVIREGHTLMPLELENILFEDQINGVWYRIIIEENSVKIQVEHRNEDDYPVLERNIADRFQKIFEQHVQVQCVPVGELYDYRTIRIGKPLSRVIDTRRKIKKDIYEDDVRELLKCEAK